MSADYAEDMLLMENEVLEQQEVSKWRREAFGFTVVYLILVLITTVAVFIRYPKTNYFWALVIAAFIWTATGAISIWYSYLCGQPWISVFLFITFLVLYWTLIYNTLEKNNVVILNVSRK